MQLFRAHWEVEGHFGVTVRKTAAFIGELASYGDSL